MRVSWTRLFVIGLPMGLGLALLGLGNRIERPVSSSYPVGGPLVGHHMQHRDDTSAIESWPISSAATSLFRAVQQRTAPGDSSLAPVRVIRDTQVCDLSRGIILIHAEPVAHGAGDCKASIEQGSVAWRTEIGSIIEVSYYYLVPVRRPLHHVYRSIGEFSTHFHDIGLPQ